MIKLILLDLDGTLLKEHHLISEKNINAIQHAKSKGVLVGICTGRNPLSALLFSSIAGADAPVICCGGGLIFTGGQSKLSYSNIYDVKDELKARESIFEARIHEETVFYALEVSKKTGIPFHACTSNGFYLVGGTAKNALMSKWSKQARDMINVDERHYTDYDDFFSKYAADIIRISFSSTAVDDINNVLKFFKNNENVNVTISLKNIIEITSKGVDKGQGTLKLCKYLGICPQEVGCIGDDNNDMPMFKVCGKGIAMGNAIDKLKDISDYTVGSDVLDGCADGIYRLLEEV